MQKTMICLARPALARPALARPALARAEVARAAEIDTWQQQLRALVTDYASLFLGCSMCIPDKQVAPAHLLEMKNTQHPKDAVVSIWSDNISQLDEFMSELRTLGELQAYGVFESAPIPRQSSLGRTEGMCQIAFIKKPAAMENRDWQHIWLGNHTQIAIDTQSTFAYRQNIVAVPLPLDSASTPNWPLMDAIVEENFPAEAMTSRDVFFDSENDPVRFESNQQIMLESCFKFIDFDAFDCVPMSEYTLKPRIL